MKEILIPLNFTTTPVLYDSKQSFSASDEESGVLTFTTTADVTGTVASLTIRNASENAIRQTVLIERLDVNSSPFSYAVKMPLPFGNYEGELLLKKNLTVVASAKFLFGVNSSLSAEVLPKLVEAYSLDALVEEVETEVSNLKDAYNLTVSETVKGVNKTESTLQLSENVRYLNEATRKANELLRISQEAARVVSEGERVTEFGNLVDSAVIEQTVTQEVAEKYQEIEATQANRLLSAEQQLAEIEIIADAMASGSPKGVYATVALLQAAYPTGTTGAYLVTADGNWYYWSGSAWTVGGLYQAGTLKNYKRQLTAGDNLDTFFAEGAYLLTTATTPGTYPSGVSTYAIFEVEGTGNFITQRITNTVGGGNATRVWVRSWQSSWGAWVELTNVTFKTYKRSLASGDNIDTLLAEGQYWLNKATTTLGTYPTGLSTYSMLDIQGVGSNYVVQTLTNLVGTGKPRVFKRTYQTTWSIWMEIADVADVDSTSIMAINTVTNSSFSSGLTGFAVGANIVDEAVVGDTLTFTGVGYSKSLPNTVQGGERTVAGHKYYISSFAKYTATPGSIILGVLEDGATLPLTTTLTRYSTIVTAITGNYYAYTMAATTGTDITVQKPLSIDLTALFGAGNEPSKETIDEMINTVAGGFDGTKNILTPEFVFERMETLLEKSKAIPSYWNGKTASFLGDSITEGATVDGSYVPVVKDLLGLTTVNNYGIGGGRLCKTTPEIDALYTPLVDRFTLIDTTADIIFVLIGTNDYASQVPIGATNSNSTYEFKGALNIIMDWLRTNMPDKLVIFSTQLHRFNDETFTIKMQEYRDAVKERCLAKKFVCYDAFTNTGFDFVAGYYDHILTADGLHPNTAGNNILGRKIAGFINAQ